MLCYTKSKEALTMFPSSYCPLLIHLRKIIHMPHCSCASCITIFVYSSSGLLPSSDRSYIITSSMSNKNCLQLSQSSQSYRSLECYHQHITYNYQNISDF